MEKIINALARELNIKPKQAEATVQLLDEGHSYDVVWRHQGVAAGGEAGMDVQVAEKLHSFLAGATPFSASRVTSSKAVFSLEKMTMSSTCALAMIGASTGRPSGTITQAKSISAATAITFMCACTVIQAMSAWPRPMTWERRSQV